MRLCSMHPKKHALGLDPMGGHRFSDKCMDKREVLYPNNIQFSVLGIIALVAIIFGSLTFSAKATPPDMICEVNDPSATFTVILVTNNSNLNSHSIVPLSLHHSNLSIEPPVEGFGFTQISLYSEDLLGQWLMDGRVDLQIYKEEKLDGGQLFSTNLTIKTKSTGKRSEESGHVVHKGTYELQLFSGSKRDNTGKLVKQFDGDVSCGNG